MGDHVPGSTPNEGRGFGSSGKPSGGRRPSSTRPKQPSRTADLANRLAFEIRALKLPPPVREFRFSERRWRFDLAWPDLLLALEVDGGEWIYGRHQRPEGFRNDAEKMSWAAIRGWRVLRCTGSMVEDGTALGLAQEALEALRQPR